MDFVPSVYARISMCHKNKYTKRQRTGKTIAGNRQRTVRDRREKKSGAKTKKIIIIQCKFKILHLIYLKRESRFCACVINIVESTIDELSNAEYVLPLNTVQTQNEI